VPMPKLPAKPAASFRRIAALFRANLSARQSTPLVRLPRCLRRSCYALKVVVACCERTIVRLAAGKRGGIDCEIYGAIRMKGISFALSTMAILASLAMAPVGAQERAMEPRMQLHAVNPSLSTSAPTNSPIQQQMRQDYATGLMSAQRDLLQQNPSGLSRQEEAIGRELNGYVGPR
jgi:hypothetical protein